MALSADSTRRGEHPGMTDTVRAMRDEDAVPLAQLVHRAIHEGASGAYTLEQRIAWSPAPKSADMFLDRVAGQLVLVAEDEIGLSGLFTLTDEGLLDLAFVRPDKMGKGTATALYRKLLEGARERDLARLTVEASHLARRFFEKQGWQCLETQTVTPNGVAMQNHRMILDL